MWVFLSLPINAAEPQHCSPQVQAEEGWSSQCTRETPIILLLVVVVVWTLTETILNDSNFNKYMSWKHILGSLCEVTLSPLGLR